MNHDTKTLNILESIDLSYDKIDLFTVMNYIDEEKTLLNKLRFDPAVLKGCTGTTYVYIFRSRNESSRMCRLYVLQSVSCY